MKAEEAGLTGRKKEPLLKGKSMVDGRTKDGKRKKQEMEGTSRQVLAGEAAERRIMKGGRR